MDAKARFMAKVVEQPDGCWHWAGAIQSATGYGRFSIASPIVDYAHRASYRLFVGDIPPGALVCHHCDVRHCVRPSHLFVGSHADNMQDASRKGRVVIPAESFESNERHQVAKLTDEQVRNIRATAPGTRGLAKLHGVSKTAIWMARTGRTFRGV